MRRNISKYLYIMCVDRRGGIKTVGVFRVDRWRWVLEVLGRGDWIVRVARRLGLISRWRWVLG